MGRAKGTGRAAKRAKKAAREMAKVRKVFEAAERAEAKKIRDAEREKKRARRAERAAAKMAKREAKKAEKARKAELKAAADNAALMAALGVSTTPKADAAGGAFDAVSVASAGSALGIVVVVGMAWAVRRRRRGVRVPTPVDDGTTAATSPQAARDSPRV